MKTRFTLFFVSLFAIICSIFSSSLSHAQSTFSLDGYKNFLKKNADLTAQKLVQLYPTGAFNNRPEISLSPACFGDSIAHVYKLTAQEKEKIGQNGFMVTERLSYPAFGYALVDIFKKDLPVFISTDAILHALHYSYDNILQEMETNYLMPRFQTLLSRMQLQLQNEVTTEGQGEMRPMFEDADLYLTVARRLLEADPISVSPIYPENQSRVREILQLIENHAPASYPLFVSPESSSRDIDFSQFVPRGHYTTSPELTRYFKALMWLGRTEIYLAPPHADKVHEVDKDIVRQMVDALLIVQLLDKSKTLSMWQEAEDLIRFFVGESDNITPIDIKRLMAEAKITKPAQLLEDAGWKRFRDALAGMPDAGQAIVSQILYRAPEDPDSVAPATAFLLFGQRFIIDSYVLSNVVYDRVRMMRMLPSPFDVLFALGNNAAAPFLREDLDRYSYAPNLAGVRYLIDSYDSTFWNETFYNSWLNVLRSLNPPSPDKRNELPRFMRTEAWWHEKMNTQLASWAEMRHDNLLYGKQSYTTAVSTCSYPKSFVEPIPEFFHRLTDLARRAERHLSAVPKEKEEEYIGVIVRYFQGLAGTCDTLGTIAEKELRDEALNDGEIQFLRSMIREFRISGGCGGGTPAYDGWYARLFYSKADMFGITNGGSIMMNPDYIVADVHTAPTDSEGNPTGWVVHVGTGSINMAVVTCDAPDGSACAYIGPVMSYYEHTTTGFDRLTDERWWTMHSNGEVPRPEWTNLYLVGAEKSEGR